MSFAILIRKLNQELPVGIQIYLLDSEATPNNISNHSAGKTLYCPSTPSEEQLVSLLSDIVPNAMRKGWPIVVNSNVEVPPALRGPVGIYQDRVGEHVWELLPFVYEKALN